MKNKKDLRIEIVKKLEGIKKFRVSWAEETNCSVDVEAKTEDEARKMLLNGTINQEHVEYGDSDQIDGSIQVYEVEE